LTSIQYRGCLFTDKKTAIGFLCSFPQRAEAYNTVCMMSIILRQLSRIRKYVIDELKREKYKEKEYLKI